MEVLGASVEEKYENDDLDTGLNILRDLKSVHTCAPKERIDERVERNPF